MSNPHHRHQVELDRIRKGSINEVRYPNGYTPKIEYYQEQLSMAVNSLDIEQIKYFTNKLEWFIENLLGPAITFALRFRYAIIALFLAVAIVTVGLVKAHAVRFLFFPQVEILFYRSS